MVKNILNADPEHLHYLLTQTNLPKRF